MKAMGGTTGIGIARVGVRVVLLEDLDVSGIMRIQRVQREIQRRRVSQRKRGRESRREADSRLTSRVIQPFQRPAITSSPIEH
jgi:hypothetical protein